ncbi:putative MFS multidrug transporter [Aspergillus candidus]|uniref:Major facilitator superfamily domain-containing protein n=1 Tax=Aspergillus candidus TaxID=41067 RepID=A0A2I2FGQ2_ASPCN|nr:major facilitator superfamily domain-containing protein [Aspergillus candidus]PLB39815.1 major facilitator superfamily domain-containing protein [Aspergillus candidus]
MRPSQHDTRSSVDNVPTTGEVAGQHHVPPRDPHGSPGRDVPDEEDNTSVSTVIYDGNPRVQRDAAPPSNRSDSSDDDDASSTKSEKPVTWRTLPKKGQLAILTFARLSEPLTQTSLQAYLFYQLKSFDPSLPDSTISAQAGLLQGTFTAAQFVTAVWWGRLADAEWMGRKRVLMISLLGTCISCLGYGFSRSFVTAAIFRTLGGILNSNIGVMRTMIAEIVEEKRYQSRAFLLLPMCFNIGVIIGPVLGGSLADPVNSYPQFFGPGSFFGGKEGVYWMKHWPFALPNVLSAIFIFASLIAVLLGLEETHEVARYHSDWGRKLGRTLARSLSFRRIPRHYRALVSHPDDESLYVDGSVTSRSAPASPAHVRALVRRKRPSFGQTWTRNVLLTLFAHFLLAFHTSAFNAMTFVFLPTPRAPKGSNDGFFHFGGGMGLPSARVGLATAIIGVIGLPLQIFVYPHVQSRMGTLPSFRTFLPFSPISYALMPFLVLIPRIPWLVWSTFTFVVGLQVVSRTFALPAAIILVNNCVTDPSVLGTVHGVAQSVSSAARTLGPLLGGWGLGLGLKYNMVGAVWWALAVEALLGWFLLWSIFEGRGIEKRDPPVDEDEES